MNPLGLALLLALAPLLGDRDEAEDADVPAKAADGEVVHLSGVRLEGNKRTTDETLLELLPRRPPTSYRAGELAELERRINNLGIFDQVVVRVEREILVVAVREKFTLTPSLDFSTGESLKDIEVSAGATEYNFLGRAAELGLVVGREQRGPTAWIWLVEHALRPNRWAFGVAAGFDRASLRFGDDPDHPTTSWSRDRATGEVVWRTPYGYGLPLRYEVGAFYTRELIERHEGDRPPPDGHAAGTTMMFTFDRYTWKDLVPHGIRLKHAARLGWFFPEGMARWTLETTALAALPLGKHTVLTGRAEHELVTSGNVNHSTLVGSQDGVRGLADAYFRNRQHAYANVELRHAIKLAERWAVQGVVFGDAGGYEPMTELGTPTSWAFALGTGAGIRLIPTFLTQLLARVDLARLLVPEGRWFLQLGVTQYF